MRPGHSAGERLSREPAMRPCSLEGTRPLLLATDLDGTLLGGSDEDRGQLAGIIGGDDRFQVIFVTGRNSETVRPYLDDPLVPAPDFIIGDVGATVVRGRDLTPVQPLSSELEADWPGEEAVDRALASFSFLERQSVPQERRRSYLVDPEHWQHRDLLEAIESVGCSAVFSAGRFLDVVPRGVSKGTTLLRLIDLEELDIDSAVVAGDTLNDLSMFETGLKGVVVGNGEAALKDHVAGMASVVVARREGAAGILEGLEHHGFIGAPPTCAVGCRAPGRPLPDPPAQRNRRRHPVPPGPATDRRGPPSSR